MSVENRSLGGFVMVVVVVVVVVAAVVGTKMSLKNDPLAGGKPNKTQSKN